MSERYPGGLIRKTAPTVTGPTDGEGGSASGVWKLEDVGYYEEEGGWPKRTLPRELYSWGDNSQGQLGQNTAPADLSSPVQVGALTDWSSIGAGKLFVTAITTTNKLFSWGNNTSYGMLGLGDTVDRSSPVQVGSLTNWEQTSGANDTCMAVKTDNTLWFWGRNAWGQRGDNTTTGDETSPVQVGSDTDWASVSTFGNSVVAVKTNGELYSWGLNSSGGLGHNDTVHRSSPTQIGSLTTWSKAVCGNGPAMLAVKTDGTLWAWGQQQFDGKLGINSTVNTSSPVQVGALTNWSSVDISGHSAAIKTDGTIWTWGAADSGQLGHNNTTRRSSPVQVGSLSTWSQVSTGQANTFAVKTDGTAWSWGNNTSGGLGLGDTANQSSPVQIGSNTDWNSLTGSEGSTAQVAVYGITKGS